MISRREGREHSRRSLLPLRNTLIFLKGSFPSGFRPCGAGTLYATQTRWCKFSFVPGLGAAAIMKASIISLEYINTS